MARDRDEILRSAARYLGRDGIRTVGMQDMAEALDVSRSSLYHHFLEKSDLIHEILVRTLTQFTQRVGEIADYPIPATQRLAITFRAVLRLQLETPTVPLALLLRDGGASLKPDQRADVIARRDAYEGLFRRIVADGVAAGEFRPVNIKIVTIALLAMLDQFDSWFDAAGPLTSEDVADIFSDTAIAALDPARARGPHADPVPPRRRGRPA